MTYSTLVISDFSKTLTEPTSKSTWSLFKASEVLGGEFGIRRDALFEEYYPFELAGNDPMVQEWFGKHLDLMMEYGAISDIEMIVAENMRREYLLPRRGLREFHEWTQSVDAVVQITSSGITELIGEFFRQHDIPFLEGIPQGSKWGILANAIAPREVETIAIPLNKMPLFRERLDISERFNRIIVLGDARADFDIEGLDYADPRVQGFLFSDTESIAGVTTLPRNESLSVVVEMIEGRVG